MKWWMSAMAAGIVVLGPVSARAADPAASVATTQAERWTGTASEFQGIYSGPVSATVTLDLRPDGTFTETWKEGTREMSHSGHWQAAGNTVLLRADDRSHERLTLRRRGDTLYNVAVEAFPNGRTTTAAITLRPAA